MEIKQKESKELPSKVVRDSQFGEYFIRRAFGGVQPDGTFVMSLYDVNFVPDDGFRVSHVEKSEKCKLTMTRQTAKSIAEWILKNIEDTENANKSSDEKPPTSSDPMVR